MTNSPDYWTQRMEASVRMSGRIETALNECNIPDEIKAKVAKQIMWELSQNPKDLALWAEFCS